MRGRIDNCQRGASYSLQRRTGRSEERAAIGVYALPSIKLTDIDDVPFITMAQSHCLNGSFQLHKQPRFV